MKWFDKYVKWVLSFSKLQSFSIGILLAALVTIMFFNGASVFILIPTAYITGSFLAAFIYG